MNYDEKIKITMTVTREIANHIESAIEVYIGMDNDSDEDDTGMLDGLRKAQSVINRAYMNNKTRR
jgi:hypothetical protein